MTIDPNMQANIDALCAALKNVDGSELASQNVSDVKIEANDKGLTISFDMMVDGTKMPVVLSTMPELEAPEDGSADAIALGTLIEKLGALDVSGMSSEEAAEFMKQVISSVIGRTLIGG